MHHTQSQLYFVSWKHSYTKGLPLTLLLLNLKQYQGIHSRQDYFLDVKNCAEQKHLTGPCRHALVTEEAL